MTVADYHAAAPIEAALYFGDAQARLVDLDLAAPLAVSDPPYPLTTAGGMNDPRRMRGGMMKHYSGKPVACAITWPEIMAVLDRVTAVDADLYVFVNDKNMRAALNAAHEAGFRLHNILTWDKVTATANRWYMKNLEFVLYLFKGRARTISSPGSKAGQTVPHKDVTDHPTEKPVALLRGYIANSSNPGDLVVDPFAGSGSTGVAAIEIGRRFVGCEIDPQWHRAAVPRLVRAQADFEAKWHDVAAARAVRRPMPAAAARPTGAGGQGKLI
jgi:site-specific DNA-methyltransferase (adenine-specific)